MTDPLAAVTADLAAELLTLKLSQIREPDQALRGAERRQPEAWRSVRDSIREKGVLLPILVRPSDEPGVYVLIDGMQRFTVSRETGKRTIPARVLHVDSVTSLEIQIIANLHRVETSPVRYAEQLRLLMQANPSLTAPKLAVKLDKSPTWVYNTLGLLKLDPAVQSLVDQGKIPIANAQALAKLPEKDQGTYAPLAQEQQPQEFTPKMTEIARQIKEGGREGRKEKEYVHVDHFQKMKSVKDEITRGDVRKALFREVGELTPAAAFKLALEWVLHRDPISVRHNKAKEAEAARPEGREAEGNSTRRPTGRRGA